MVLKIQFDSDEENQVNLKYTCTFQKEDITITFRFIHLQNVFLEDGWKTAALKIL